MTEPTNEPITAEALEKLRKDLTDANAEAAKYRVEKKDAVEAAKQEAEQSFTSKIQELEEALANQTTEATTSRTEVTKLKVALAAGIATDKVESFASILAGDTPEQLASHADELKKLFTTDDSQKSSTPPTDPTQGIGNHIPLNGDPLLAKVLATVNR